MSYKISLESSTIAKDGYNSKSAKGDSSSLLEGLAYIAKQSNKSLVISKKTMEEEIISINKTYAREVAISKVAEKRASYNNTLNYHKVKLHQKNDEIRASRNHAQEQYFTSIPDPTVISWIDSLRDRKGHISEEEWKMIVKKVSDKGNYQELKKLETIATEIGFDFSVPISVEQAKQDTDSMWEVFNHIIDYYIDKPESEWDYNTLSVLGEYDRPTYIQQKMQDMDKAAGTLPEDKSNTYLNRLKKARDNALHAGDIDTFNEIHNFIYDHIGQFDSPEEVEAMFHNECENLIEKGMNAVEK